MSNTPRTDAVEKHAYEFKDEYTPVCESKFVRQLERELNAANQRIQRLEEAGDQLAKWVDRNTPATILNDWTAAKEAKL